VTVMAEEYSELANEIVSAANGIDYAYRDTGGGSEGAVPLVLLQRFRGNLETGIPRSSTRWPPPGGSSRSTTPEGGSAGTTPDTIAQLIRILLLCRHDPASSQVSWPPRFPGWPKTAYTANAGDGTVTPIDLATHIARAPIDVPGAPGPNGDGAPWVIAITPNGKTAYVATVGGKLIPIHLATGTLGKPIGGVGSFPQIAIAPNGKVAYVTNSGSQTILPIDLTTGLRGALSGLARIHHRKS